MSNSNTTVKHYIGIDPSINSTGLGLITVYYDDIVRRTQVVKPSKDLSTYLKIVHTRKIAQAFFLEHTREGTVMQACIEGASHNSQGRHDDLGQNRGVLKIMLTDLFGIIPLQPAPTTLKKFAAGRGVATKGRMITKARAMGWAIAEKEDDAADAAHLADLANATLNFREMSLVRTQLEVLHTLGLKLK